MSSAYLVIVEALEEKETSQREDVDLDNLKANNGT